MRLALALLGSLLAGFVWAEEFSFDATEFEQKPFEFGGYVEFKANRNYMNASSNLYLLSDLKRSTLDQQAATLKLNAKYTHGISSLKVRGDAEFRHDDLTSERISRFDEAFASFAPDPGFTLDIGKVALKWGKGYAWNPVAFVERPKDPNDVELAREGYTLLAADLISNFDGDLKTIAFTPVLLPVSTQLNADFGTPDHVNVATKLYLLYRDTDIDFIWANSGSRTARFGVDFSRNLTSALEIHGEWARISDLELRDIDAAGNVTTNTRDVSSYLAGLRFLTEQDTTWIAEYYRNGNGYSEAQFNDFHYLVDSGSSTLFAKAKQISPAYARAYAGRDYFYLKISQKEPFDILYFTPSCTLIANVADASYSLMPELLYIGITNLDLRLRAAWLNGKANSEFGEKQISRKFEMLARLYF